MGAKPTTPQLRSKIEAAIAGQKQFVDEMKGNKNPQVVEMVLKCEARIEAWDAVLWAINGSGVLLNTYIKNS
jgi:hypothetical protein